MKYGVPFRAPKYMAGYIFTLFLKNKNQVDLFLG